MQISMLRNFDDTKLLLHTEYSDFRSPRLGLVANHVLATSCHFPSFSIVNPTTFISNKAFLISPSWSPDHNIVYWLAVAPSLSTRLPCRYSYTVLSTAMDSHTTPTIEEIKEWGVDKLLVWIQQKRPTLLIGDKLEKFKVADISGENFLMQAGNEEFFEKKCNLPIGPSLTLAHLAAEIVSIKSKVLSFILCTSR
jgi:hypothetical protein